MTNILNEILHSCANKNIQIDEDFLHYYYELLHLDPELNLENRTNIQNFIESVVTKLQNQSLDIIIMKMQFFFDSNFNNNDKVIKKNRKNLETKLESLYNDIIVDTNFPNQSSSIQLIYKKIVYYIALMSGLGNPSVDQVFKETLYALKSILNESELREFMEEKHQQKKSEQLTEMRKLVTGIRLFNRDCQKGGEGIQDCTDYLNNFNHLFIIKLPILVPQLLEKATISCKNNIQETLSWVMNCVNLLTTALDMIYDTKQDEHNNFYVECDLTDDITEENVEDMKNFLIAFRQYEIYLRKSIDEIKQLEERVNLLVDDYQKTLHETHKIVYNRITIPVVQVFPKFTKIANSWYSLQDETMRLTKFNSILNGLNNYMKALHFNQNIAEKILHGNPPKTDSDRLLKTVDKELIENNETIEIIKSENIQNIDEIHMQYLGFCAWKLIETEGALISGNPNLGIIKAMNMNFVVSSFEAGIEFGRRPERYILGAMDLARKKPQLVNLLQLRNQFDVIKQSTPSPSESPPVNALQDSEVQTITHPIAEYIDKTYKWNIWEYKREALRTANYSKCKTKTGQTTKTYGYFTTSSQTYPLKNQTCQTKTDNYTNVPKMQNFIYGLRGRRDDKQFIVDLTRPVNE